MGRVFHKFHGEKLTERAGGGENVEKWKNCGKVGMEKSVSERMKK